MHSHTDDAKHNCEARHQAGSDASNFIKVPTSSDRRLVTPGTYKEVPSEAECF